MDETLLINVERVNISHVSLLLIAFSPHVNENNQVASRDHHETSADARRCSGLSRIFERAVGPHPCFEPTSACLRPGNFEETKQAHGFSTLGISAKAFLHA